MPLLVDVPVIFPSGGNFIFTLPVQEGDEALIVFASRCIDSWWDRGGVQPQAELRHHDLSDGFAIVGPFSKPNVPANVSTSTAQMRTKDGLSYIELTEDGIINLIAPGGVNVHGPLAVQGASSFTGNANINGTASIEGTVSASGDGTFNGHSVSNHIHPDPQGGVTGPPQG
jgi:hypothetical protein